QLALQVGEPAKPQFRGPVEVVVAFGLIADERPAAEEPEVGIPGPCADSAAVPAGAAVGRPGLPGVDVDVGRVEPAVEPDRVQVAVAGPGYPGEELVVAGGLAGLVDRQEPGVGPVLSAVGGPLEGDVGLGHRPVDVVLVQEGQRPG